MAKKKPEFEKQDVVVMEKFTQEQAQEDVNEVRNERKHKRRPRADAWLKLRPFATQILGWARAKGASRALVKRLLEVRLGVIASASQIYRFVCHLNGGRWTHPRIA